MGGNNDLGEGRVMLAASLMFEFELNFGEIIVDKIKLRAINTNTSYPFPCLIKQIGEEAYVLVLIGINIKTIATKTHNFERTKYEGKLGLLLGESANV